MSQAADLPGLVGAVGVGAAAWRAALRQFSARVIGVEIRRFVLWLPVVMALGIWCYMAAPEEPPDWLILAPLMPVAALGLGAVRRNAGARAIVIVTLAFTTGHMVAQTSAWRAAMPGIAAPFAATLEGRVVTLDRAASGAPRVLLDRVTAFGRAAERMPDRVRVTLSAMTRESAPRPGDWIWVHATLLTPRAPVEPGAFDFARRAYFDRIGAIGFARQPAVRVPAVELAGTRARADRPDVWARGRAALDRLRLALADGIRARLSGSSGAFAAAILVGDRAAIAEEHVEALRISSLAHLLAISGLHMGLLCGLVFASVRISLALCGGSAEGAPGKKIAAGAALLAGLGYLALSGTTVATQRAFVMVAVALVAVMLDRPAITLRAVALAAVIVLAIRPISLFDPGFQMSFAATTALVAAFAAERDARAMAEQRGERRRRRSAVWRWTMALVASSLIAGLATAPIAALHFHRLTPYGLGANLLAVPAMGLWIMPWAAVATVLAPLGLAEGPLLAMCVGIDWVLRVALEVAAMPGADRRIAAGPVWAMALLAVAGLWLALWRGPWRFLGAAGALAAVLAWTTSPPARPDLLIAQEGALIGLMTPAGRVLDRAAGQGYAAERWLARDGDPATQAHAAARSGLSPGDAAARRPRRRLHGTLGTGSSTMALTVVRGAPPTPLPCRAGEVLVVPKLQQAPPGECVFIGKDLLSRGAVAVWLGEGGLRLRSSASDRRRPWHR